MGIAAVRLNESGREADVAGRVRSNRQVAGSVGTVLKMGQQGDGRFDLGRRGPGRPARLLQPHSAHARSELLGRSRAASLPGWGERSSMARPWVAAPHPPCSRSSRRRRQDPSPRSPCWPPASRVWRKRPPCGLWGAGCQFGRRRRTCHHDCWPPVRLGAQPPPQRMPVQRRSCPPSCSCSCCSPQQVCMGTPPLSSAARGPGAPSTGVRPHLRCCRP